jgi:hypothetical protein
MIGFDRGPSKALAQHLADAPGHTAAQRRLFWYDWGPVFYRGRVSGTARLLGSPRTPGRPSESPAAHWSATPGSASRASSRSSA